ncbi:MAG: tRNA threonylcarbamoyladenosine dehydratase [Prevotella sp.]|nr:tRNA threonylcarbamoyladenosine dehydratase [Prevotella sp.]
MQREEDIFSRVELLLGGERLESLRNRRVILFGVGGVGSWCAECLVRSGLGNLTLVDFDRVCASNINRQLMATTETVGQVKVEVLRERLLTINPQADIVAVEKVYTANTADEFDLDSYDYVIDAIDSLRDKALLIERACQSQATLFSSMGAALKLDPTRIQIAEFWKVKGDPLARALRNYFKKSGCFPKRKFQCVFSDELLKNVGGFPEEEETATQKPSKRPNGTLAHITAIFGCMLASLVIREEMRH